MVHSRQKKLKGDDAFAKKKQKVGKKKLAPATATRAEVHARTLRISSSVKNIGDTVPQFANAAISGPRRTFRENIIAASHYREGVRKSAFQALHLDVTQPESHMGPVFQIQLMTLALDAMTDTDVTVRHEVVRTLSALLRRVQPDVHTASAVLQSCHIALTHAVTGVRRTGVEVLDALLTEWPGVVRSTCISHQATSMRIVDRTSEVALLHIPLMSTLNKLLSECFADDAGGVWVADVVTSVVQFYDKVMPTLAIQWKECVELQAALFRDKITFAKAVSVARIISTLSAFIQRRGLLNRQHTRQIRDLFVARVPISMRELASGHAEESKVIALVVAEGCVPICSHSDDACKSILTYITTTLSLSTVSHTALMGVQRILVHALSLHPALVLKFASVLTPLVNATIQAIPSSPLPATAVALCTNVGAILMRCCQQEGYPNDGLVFLATALDLIPRLLFAARKLQADDDVDVVAARLLRVLWDVASSRHPVVAVLNLETLGQRLHSMFGFGAKSKMGTEEAVPGVLQRTSPATSLLGRHLFFYLGVDAPSS